MSKAKKEFLGLTKVLQKISRRHQFANVFDDFMQMAICAFSMGKMEDVYLPIAAKYSAEDLPIFGQALAEMINEYENGMSDDGGWVDVLGNVFEETNSSFAASGAGQFFTPETVCNVMAQLTAGTDECEDGIVVNDCACGSGRNLIAHSRLHPKNRFNAFYVGQDLDERCVKMCVLNYFMYGIKGIVIHQDTLWMKIFGGYRIYLADTLMGIAPLTINECYAYLTKEKEVETPIKIIDVSVPQNLLQAKLF
jgi:type I restriction-modification system DNA methylase subunit